MDDPEGDVGVRLKVVRQLYGISQRELARRAGVTNATISFIEQGRVSPSVSSLSKILGAVSMSLPDFFSLELSEPKQIFFRGGDMPDIGRGRISCRLFGDLERRSEMSLLWKVFPVGQNSSFSLEAAQGEVGGVVVAGNLEVTIGSDVALLNTGDGYYFNARRPHRFRNTGNRDCVVVSAITPAYKQPGTDDSPAEEDKR
ncbi:helix-turn-helix domain-containing protein [Microbulbifer sp. OS29]|uniref:Helix-turn-helix domain-containing protein n=1 Tax=Microbulbifer okhotskensis TaxID=2926617 RepID=A0A9X2J6B0_9GAMM|nr:helix-turn-helix domain-containing protein [Microbulbifer okhotskensis]MCO1333286.1 helix-turn-helix domain-containing protein [Microbulbifer okhotskensis]